MESLTRPSVVFTATTLFPLHWLQGIFRTIFILQSGTLMAVNYIVKQSACLDSSFVKMRTSSRRRSCARILDAG